MQFLYPSFLWALLALAIPIIVHLFYFRRFKKVYFTNVRLLKEIKEETSSRNKLKNLLVLLMRLLTVASLVFAFAQPFIPKNNDVKSGSKAVSIFVDNSFSMKAEKENVPLIELAKDKAKTIVEAYSPDDQFQIITNDFEGRHQRLISKENAITLINEIEISPTVQNVASVINRQKQILKSENNISFVISDFQRSVTNIDRWQDSTLSLNLIPVQSVIDKNVSIDSVWFVAPTPMLNQNNQLVIKLHNYSNQDADDVKTSFLKDGQEKPIAIKSIAAGSSRLDTVAISVLKAGIHEAQIKVVDFPVQFDDQYYISFLIPEKAKVLAINQGKPNRYLDALFKGINYFEFENQDVNQVQYQKFADYDLILLNDLQTISSGLANELNQFIRSGGNVLTFPSTNIDKNAYNTFYGLVGANTLGELDKKERQVGSINTDEFIFSDVFENVNRNLKLPTTKLNYTQSSLQRSGKESILKYRDGTDYLSKFVAEEGQLFICTAPLSTDYNDLVINAEIFVPMIYKVALSKVKQEKLGYQIGKDNIIDVERSATIGENVYKIKGTTEFIPSMSNFGKKILLDVKGQVKEAGFYNLMLDDKELRRLAFNYDRQESDLSYYNEDELADLVKNDEVNIISAGEQGNIKQYVSENDKGVVLWKWFIIAALGFLLLESIIIRWLKNKV